MPWVSPPFLKRKKGQPKLIDCPWLRFMADSSTYNKTLPNRSPPFCDLCLILDRPIPYGIDSMVFGVLLILLVLGIRD
jgi:hypothetical protein